MSGFDDNLAEIRALDERGNQNILDLEHQPLLASDPELAATSHHLPKASTTTGPKSTTMAPLFFTLSAIYGASAVTLGAFGAHGLKRRISDPARIANWSMAAQYQLIHSAVLLATSIALPARAQRIPGSLLVAGMTMFSGSIYLLVLDPQKFKALGPVTPIGGFCLIAGWIGLGIVGRKFVR